MKPARDSNPRAPSGLPDDVSAWRRRVLRHAGFDAGLAARLGADQRYDLHTLLNLVDHGCPPSVAARILAPI